MHVTQVSEKRRRETRSGSGRCRRSRGLSKYRREAETGRTSCRYAVIVQGAEIETGLQAVGFRVMVAFAAVASILRKSNVWPGEAMLPNVEGLSVSPVF